MTISVPGVSVRYEGATGRKFRLQLLEGRFLREDPHDLSIYSIDAVQHHRVCNGTPESAALAEKFLWIGNVENVQFVGPRTLIVFLSSNRNTRATLDLLAAAMIDEAETVSSTTRP